MRILLICLSLVGCSDDDAGNNNNADLAVADLAKGPDLGKLSCKQTQECAQACPQANLSTCVPACIAQLDPTIKTFFDALQQCAGPTCTVLDGGLGPCANPGSAACNTCVQQNCSVQEAACLAH